MPRTQENNKKPILSREERRAMRELRREKQRKDNIRPCCQDARRPAEDGNA